MDQRRATRPIMIALGLLTVLVVLAGCSQYGVDYTTSDSAGGSDSAAGSQSASSSQETTVYTPKYQLNGKEIGVIKTNRGTIKVKFYEKDAPIASANFIELALTGYYNGMRFHRYEPGFVIQGGDPQTKGASGEEVARAAASQTGRYGTGGPGYTIKDEYSGNPNKHIDGALAMARTGQPDSGGSQFYFTLAPQPRLDGQYTVFGQAISGIDVIHELRAGDGIESITIENATK